MSGKCAFFGVPSNPTDWDEDPSNVPEDLRSNLPHVNTTQKQFLIQLSQLAVIGRKAPKVALSRTRIQVDHGQAEIVLASLRSWRQKLPGELLATSITSWTTQGIWALVLTAWGSRLECHIHRSMWRSRVQSGGQGCPPGAGLRDSIFNLDAVFKRAVLHGLCNFMPLTLTTSAAVNVALTIELVCRTDITAGERSVYEETVRNGVMLLREFQEIWRTVTVLLSLFAWVLACKGLTFPSGLEYMETTGNSQQLSAPPHYAPYATPSYSFTTHDDEIAHALLFGNDSSLDL